MVVLTLHVITTYITRLVCNVTLVRHTLVAYFPSLAKNRKLKKIKSQKSLNELDESFQFFHIFLSHYL